MKKVRNFLFIMCDQLRADYLGCYGHPFLSTPHIDALARNSVLFQNAYCQSPVCGSSRMSFYTGRYMSSHGANWNNVPLSVHEMTLGDYLRELGLRVALIGKTHMIPDLVGMQRLGIESNSSLGVLVSECGFEPFERDDGLHPDQVVDPNLAYNRYLNEQGYDGANPWHDHANSALASNGELLSGWYMRNARCAARVAEEHSETAYMTRRAIEFIEAAGDQPWCAHLSYIKPHWPYIAPAPYHAMYDIQDMIAVNRSSRELEHAHPLVAAFQQQSHCRSFWQDQTRQAVIPAYMGLTRQIDDHIGKLMDFLEQNGHLKDTMIVFTSDHGDFLGDHWLGEKDLFYEEAVRIPMIVYDPDSRADSTRGSVDQRLVEAIDIVPTFVDAAGGAAQPHRVEGVSLLPLLRDTNPQQWRDAVFSEVDYSMLKARHIAGVAVADARAYMVRTGQWKYILYEGFRPQLFDMTNDPKEQNDLGLSSDHDAVKRELHERIFAWLRKRRTRVTMSDEDIEKRTGTSHKRGFLIGEW